jgi:hypothetical protein
MFRPLLHRLTLLFILASSIEASAGVFYLAPGGKDTNPGSKEQPLATFEAARDVARKTAGGPHRIVVLPGEFAYDDQCLYVAATVNMFVPAKISEGSTWGTDDGVEISIAGKTSDGKPATFVVRGYANGTVQSVADAGAPADAVARLGKEVRFAAKVRNKAHGWGGGGWHGEWAIPLAVIGLKPTPGLKVPFNMAAFYGEFGEWHCWEGTLAENWRLNEAGTIRFKGE